MTPSDQCAWHRWFAWRPVPGYAVQSGLGGWVWLKTIERRWRFEVDGKGDQGGWEFRLIEKDTGGEGDEGRG